MDKTVSVDKTVFALGRLPPLSLSHFDGIGVCLAHRLDFRIPGVMSGNLFQEVTFGTPPDQTSRIFFRKVDLTCNIMFLFVRVVDVAAVSKSTWKSTDTQFKVDSRLRKLARAQDNVTYSTPLCSTAMFYRRMLGHSNACSQGF